MPKKSNTKSTPKRVSWKKKYTSLLKYFYVSLFVLVLSWIFFAVYVNIDTKIVDKVEVKTSKKIVSQKVVKKTITQPSKTIFKPKLAIIIDDVAFSYHVKSIKNLGYKVTPSFFPKNSSHPDTPSLSDQFDVFMIHLPLQAKSSFQNQDIDVLKTSSSYKEIKDEIKKIRLDFPKAKYINNHTGSVFTANKDSMDMLFLAMDRYNFEFIDSMTTAKSVASQIAKKYKKKILKRDVFLDNIVDFDSIQKQAKQAVKIAKKKGQAIAIAHPKSLHILKKLKPLFKDVELVYIDELSPIK